MAGLEYVELFGLKFDELPDDSEDWTKSSLNKKMHVRKLVLYDVDANDERCNKVGTIYLDLYPRLNKVAGATHFALRHSHRKFDGKYQLPVVFLNTNFAPPESHDKNKTTGNIFGEWVRSDRARKEVSYLKHDELQTLFHEFGLLYTHCFPALDTSIGWYSRKDDFVEIPSHLMEYFVRDYRVLKHFVPKGGPGEIVAGEGELTKETLRAEFKSLLFFRYKDACAINVVDIRSSNTCPCDRMTTLDTTKIYEELVNEHMHFPHAKHNAACEIYPLINYGGILQLFAR